jgi:hypothetical protein
MITYNVLAGTTDVSVVIRIIDSTDGTPKTGVVFNTAGIALEYRRELAASVAITEVTLAALTTAHTDGGFLHIGNGYYRLDLPDAACASGVSGVLVHGTVTGMVVIGCYINLTPVPADLRTWLASVPNALVSSRVDASTGAMASGVLTATAIAADAITDAKVASDVTIASVTGSVGSVTRLTASNLDATVSSRATPAQVNTEVLDVMTVDTFAEAAAVPAATSTLKDKINWLFALARNKLTQTTTTQTLRNDADSGNVATSTVSDDGTTATRGEWS